LDGVDVRSVDSGFNHVLALSRFGEVYAWGSNSRGELGIGSTVNQLLPVRIAGLPADVVQVAARYSSSAAVTSSGEVWTWGDNMEGELGNGSFGFDKFVSHPARVENLPPIEMIAVGGSYMAALTRDGDLWVWGANQRGELGVGDGDVRYPLPTRLTLNGPVETVACGASHTIAVMKSGKVLAWGDNALGALGIGSTTNSPVPVEVSGLPGHGKPYASNSYSFYGMSPLWTFAWGANDRGQLGDGSGQNSTVPLALSLPAWASASAGTAHMALVSAENGDVYTWGRNDRGQLGYPSPPWLPTARVTGLDLGTFDLPKQDPQPTEDPTRDPGRDTTPGREPTPGTGGGGPTGPSGHQQAPPPGGTTTPPAPLTPGISRFAASFTTVITRPGRTVKIPIVTYPTPTPGTHPTSPGRVRVTWTSSTPRVATITGPKATKTRVTTATKPRPKAGTWSWTPGAPKVIQIRATTIGTSKIVLRSPGARAITLRVRVVPPKEYRPLKTVTLRATGGKSVPTRLTSGAAMWLKAIPHPLGAARVKATWTSTNPHVARIDRAGRLTALRHGRTTIRCRVHGITTTTTITVR
jgi:hypothetical protein